MAQTLSASAEVSDPHTSRTAAAGPAGLRASCGADCCVRGAGPRENRTEDGFGQGQPH